MFCSIDWTGLKWWVCFKQLQEIIVAVEFSRDIAEAWLCLPFLPCGRLCCFSFYVLRFQQTSKFKPLTCIYSMSSELQTISV